jgi:phosphomannomutase
LAGQGRVIVRPSGTEPKLKAYLEVVIPVTGGDIDTARARANVDLQAIRADLASAIGA